MFRAVFAILFAAYGAGMSQQFVPDMGVAHESARNIFKLIGEPETITNKIDGLTKEIKGRIEFRDVHFTYPGRDNAIFNGLNMTIEPNQKVAFAGPSGTGKSTIFNLLYRFYDVDKGEILLDGVNIKEYDIYHLREAFGMVGQEPKLFNESIEYNIK
jgi:ABC-type multidrug transport system fused ATPase/permease subunit